MRNLSEITDDEIVDALAFYGVEGVDIDSCGEGNAFDNLLDQLELVGEAYDESDRQTAAELIERMQAMTDRLHETGCSWIGLSPAEWGRRLEGKSAQEIANALEGGGNTVSISITQIDGPAL